ALVLLLVLLLIAKYAGMVPLCVLASVLMVVAWNMMELHRFRWLLGGPKSDAAVLLTTFGLTVLVDLTVAVQAGMVLAAVMFIKRMADVTNIGDLREDAESGAEGDQLPVVRKPPAGVEVYTIRGSFFFGAAYKLREAIDAVGKPPRVLIVDLKSVLAIDATGMHALDEMRRRCRRDSTVLFLVGVHSQPLMALAKSGMLDRFGDHNLFDSVDAALDRAERLLESAEEHRRHLPEAMHDTGH
ncbi:MAG TPA: STAS domain-containing protein, partial [Phycisphaerales bacterium]|nr:STAS domain-containing protein [Phycisphaerales bacterium]